MCALLHTWNFNFRCRTMCAMHYSVSPSLSGCRTVCAQHGPLVTSWRHCHGCHAHARVCVKLMAHTARSTYSPQCSVHRHFNNAATYITGATYRRFHVSIYWCHLSALSYLNLLVPPIGVFIPQSTGDTYQRLQVSQCT